MNKFISVKEASIKWNISERSVRNYCEQGRVVGAVFENGCWSIPDDVKKPTRLNEKQNKNYLLEKLETTFVAHKFKFPEQMHHLLENFSNLKFQN